MGNCMRKKDLPTLTLAILGLDNAGKTVTTKGLIGESLESVTPTVGFTSSDFIFNKYNITMFDLGGGKKIRDIWKNYFAEIYGLVYVIDSSEQQRIAECQSVLVGLLEHEHIQGKPLLVLANKQDKKGAMDEMEICENLDLEQLVNKYKTPCRVEPCSAILRKGKKLDKPIINGLAWLVSMIEKDMANIKQRVERDVQLMKQKEQEEKKARMERVRKIREEREKQEKAERAAKGEQSPRSDDDENEQTFKSEGDPFKRVNIAEIEEKQRKLKEEKRLQKEKEQLLRLSVGTLQVNGTDSDLMPPARQNRALPPIDSTVSSSTHTTSPGARKYDSPRPNRRLNGLTPMEGEDTENDELPSRKPLSSLYPSSRLSNGEMLEPGTRVLSPIRPLEPLETLDKKKKKKKKARKNQTMPDDDGTLLRPMSSTRASRSPRLDTVDEPDNESEQGNLSFSQKYNILDELPELPATTSINRRPNTDYDEIIT